MKNKEIVIVDDEPDILEILNYNLTKSGYKVHAFSNPVKALEHIKRYSCDMAISDWLMPEMEGLELCRAIKMDANIKDIPVIMISCKSDEIDIVTALELGAEDYLTKPFGVKELQTRIKKILKKTTEQEFINDKNVIIRNNLRIDSERHMATINNKDLQLTYCEFYVLKLLASKPGKVFSRTNIIDNIRSDEYFVTERAIDVQIVGLRKKLGPDRKLIETVRAVGYRFCE